MTEQKFAILLMNDYKRLLVACESLSYLQSSAIMKEADYIMESAESFIETNKYYFDWSNGEGIYENVNNSHLDLVDGYLIIHYVRMQEYAEAIKLIDCYLSKFE